MTKLSLKTFNTLHSQPSIRTQNIEVSYIIGYTC